MELWYSEAHSKDVKFSIKFDRQLYTEQSDFQRTRIPKRLVRTRHSARRLFLQFGNKTRLKLQNIQRFNQCNPIKSYFYPTDTQLNEKKLQKKTSKHAFNIIKLRIIAKNLENDR